MGKCEVCEVEEARTTLNVVGSRGAERIPVCDGCESKAKARDAQTWEIIREILRGQ
jgi:hypothetical protein